MKNDVEGALVSLRQSTARLAVAAIRLGATPTDILIAVNRALDFAGQVVRTEIEFTPSPQREARLIQMTLNPTRRKADNDADRGRGTGAKHTASRFSSGSGR